MPKSSIKTDETIARKCFDEIGTLSNALEEALTQEDIFKINQLLLSRGNAIEAVKKLSLATLPSSLKDTFRQQLEAIQTQEPRIQEKLEKLGKQCQEKLQQLKDSRKAISHYKLIPQQNHHQDNQA